MKLPKINIRKMRLSEAVMTLVDWEDKLLALTAGSEPPSGWKMMEFRKHYMVCAAWQDACERIKKRDDKGK